MHKKILKLGIPNILSNITIPLSASIDTALMGHLSAKHLGAIALGSMIFFFLYGSFNFLKMGTTGIVAQSYGAKDTKEITLTFYRALILACLIAIFVILFQSYIKDVAILFLHGENLKDLISEYFDIRVYAVLGAMINFVLIGYFFGVSNSIIPLIMTITINLSNAILSYILVYPLDMGISGVATGTLISQYLGVLVGVFGLRRYKFYKPSFKQILQKEKLLNFFHINKDLFIRTLALTTSLSLYYSFASLDGTLALAVATVFMQFLTWSAYGIDGFANASESLVGKYFGARQIEKVKEVVRLSLLYGFGVGVVFSFVYYFYIEDIARLFTSDSEVIKAVLQKKNFFVFIPIFGFISYIFDGILVGLTKSKVLRDSVLFGFILFLGCYYLGFGLLFSFVLFFVARGVYEMTWFFKRSGIWL